MVGTPISFGMFLCSVVLLLVGSILLYRGLRPRRQGDCPHCRTCDYNLTGLGTWDFREGAICPECGAPITPTGVVLGERRRRPGRIAGGGMALALGLVILVAAALDAVSGVNLFPLLPGPMLVRYVQPNDSSQAADNAWVELASRYKAGTLGAWARGLLIDTCLDAQQAAVGGTRIDQQVDFLGICYGKGELSPSRQKRLFQHLLTMELKVRPKIYAGSKIPWTIQRASQQPGQFLVEIPSATVRDGQDARQWPEWQMQMHGGGQGWRVLQLPLASEGRHRVTIEGQANVYFNPALATGGATLGPAAGGTACYSQKVTMSAEYEGLAPGTPDGLKRVANPAMAKSIQASAQPAGFCIQMPRRGWSPQAKPELTLTGYSSGSRSYYALPPSTAFDVFVRIEDREYPAGKAYGICGVPSWDCRVPYDGPQANSCDVILRTSEAVARDTVEIFEIWDGEIVYPNIPITVQP